MSIEDLTPENFVTLIKAMDKPDRQRITAKKLIELIVQSPDLSYENWSKVKTMEMHMADIKATIEHTKQQADTNQQEIAAMKRKNDEQANENAHLRQEIAALKEDNARPANVDMTIYDAEIKDIRNQLNDIEQYLRVNNIEIVGLPQPNAEEPEETMIVHALNALEGIEEPIRPEDIDISHPLKTKRRDGKPVHVVKFISRKKKLEILGAKKKEDNKQFKFRGQDIFINEHLSPVNRTLFAKAMEKKQTHNYRFVWTKGGTVCMRKTENSPIIQVSNEQEIAALL